MTIASLSKIEQPPVTLRDMVQERMRDAIIEGHFKPGERLVERPLCDQLGVSRTVVRETIRYLEAEGLVEILPGHGPIVAQMNWTDAAQIYDIRRMLETAAARKCAEQIDATRTASLRDTFSDLKKHLSSKAPGTLFRATSAFYAEIFNGAGHHVAWEIVQRLNGRISRLRMMTLSTTDRERPGPDHMQAIYEAIISGDPNAAEAAVARHLNDTAAIAERLLAEHEGNA
ncbi:GntR family transcriptional regulator [Sulfitobacter donghicola]|uniref:GntR family transcriptional regulator n=1 Tax=Sulfitobacter donghicola DSW-25 = KCTC 12864 = JCM 14565 TaxID=1300350 RepID=A0A073IKR8_9RHOB|nr:GntR family transcriptional regulator [Sulfitobacter donghicola]KEJ90076.1 GntR family transcriptional regulator [Sulfitobacter donghicola DSW-25 = KCTC 12864 = JCM 14565]KIN66778.1 Transcriptional regulator, GntR family [Sulfitobacter donghicola DSW-25 = KCTC 12864 = JCM 14565]